MTDDGWVVQVRRKPGGAWVTLWNTADADRDNSIFQADDVEADWDVAEKWGMARLVRCRAVEGDDD